MTGLGAEHLTGLVENCINILSVSQHDTYTNPFEIISPNMGKGLFYYSINFIMIDKM